MIKVNICGVDFNNPLIGASGTFAFGREMSQYFPLEKIGAIATKGLTLNKKDGNKGIRIFETPSGMLNSIGLENPGIDKFIEEELPFLENQKTRIIANLGGSTIEEYKRGVAKLNYTNIDFIELNISCPNLKEGGMAFGIKSKIAYRIVKEVKDICKKPLIVKLSPNAENIVDMAISCVEGGADALSLVNTFTGLAIDIDKRRPVFNNILAGLSGPCIKPIALRMVYEVAKAVQVPLIGIGGILNYKDALEYIMAGAWAVQVGCGNFINPFTIPEIIEGLEGFMEKEGIQDLEEIRGII